MESYNSYGKYEKNEDTVVSLSDIFKVLKRGLWKILLVAIACGAISFTVFYCFVPKVYTTRVKLYVDTSSSSQGANSLSSYNYATALVNTYIQMLSTNNFYEKLSADLEEKYSASELSRMVTFKSEDESQTEVFSAIVSGKTPMEAKTIADSVAVTAPGVISSLKSDSTELRIVDNATVPVSPSSPNVIRNTILAMCAGAVLTIILIFIKEAIDNKIKYSVDITMIRKYPILSAVPDFGIERFILQSTDEAEPKESEA